MAIVLDARGKADQGQQQATDNALPVEADAVLPAIGSSLAREVINVGVGDIRHPNRLAQIGNDVTVTFKFGTAHVINAYLQDFEGRKTESRGKIPGTEILLPPIHFLTFNEFSRLVRRAERMNEFADEMERRPDTVTLAWMDRSAGVMEIGVRGAAGKKLPPALEMSGKMAKELLATIVHEAAHGAGKGEFGAFRAEHDFLQKIGVVTERKSNLELMLLISDLYSDNPAAVSEAQDEFVEACKAEGETEQLDAYWRILNEQLAADPVIAAAVRRINAGPEVEEDPDAL